MNKKLELLEAMRAFGESNQTVDNTLALFQKVSSSVRQGTGLLWSDVKDVIEQYFKEKELK